MMEDQTSQKGEKNISHTATRVAESVLIDEEDLTIDDDDDVTKLSIKRKNPENKSKCEKVSKVPKTNPVCPSSQSEDSLSNTQDSDSPLSGHTQVDVESVYSFTRIRSFLQDTKGMRSVKVENFFPDLKLFIDSVRLFMRNTGCTGQPSFTDQEVFRLKKLVLKVKSEMADD